MITLRLMQITGGAEKMDDCYDAQVYSLDSGWFQDRLAEDYVYSVQYSARLLPFIICLQQIVLGLLSDPNYQEEF
jgi:hypothetical protein